MRLGGVLVTLGPACGKVTGERADSDRRSGVAAAAPHEDGPNPLDIVGAHEQAVTLDDAENRIDARVIARDEFDMYASRSAGFGQDLSLEPILPYRYLDEPGGHARIVQRRRFPDSRPRKATLPWASVGECRWSEERGGQRCAGVTGGDR